MEGGTNGRWAVVSIVKIQALSLVGLVLLVPNASAALALTLNTPDVPALVQDIDRTFSGTTHAALAPLEPAAAAPAAPGAPVPASANSNAPSAPLASSSNAASAPASAATSAAEASAASIPVWAWASTIALLGIALVIVIGAFFVHADRKNAARSQKGVAPDVAAL